LGASSRGNEIHGIGLRINAQTSLLRKPEGKKVLGRAIDRNK
jgi:hypothetical protein